MNERIRELAHEAGLPTYNPDGIPTKLEKFAQLIVKETLQVARAGIEFGDDMEDVVYKYFGVEE